MGIFPQVLCLSPPKTKYSTKMQEKENQKVVFISLSIHTNLEHEEHTQKKKPYQPTQGLQTAEITLISLKLGNRSTISQIISTGRLDKFGGWC